MADVSNQPTVIQSALALTRRLKALRGGSIVGVGVGVGLLMATPTLASQPDFDAIYDHSHGKDAYDYRKQTTVNLQLDGAFVDASSKTHPLETTNFDRSALLYNRLWTNLVINQRFGMRFSLWLKGGNRREHATEATANVGQESWGEGRGTLELILHGNNGFEITGGLGYHYVAAHTYTVTNASAEIITEYREVAIPVPHLTFMRRTSSTAFGLYYTSSAQRDREVIKTSEQDPNNTLIFTEPVHFPNSIGLFLGKRTGKNNLFIETVLVRGSGGGPQSPEGDAIFRDHFRARGIYYKSLGPTEVEASFTYRGHSFAQSKNNNATTIAMSVLNLKFILGKEFSHVFFGGIMGYGEGGQSSEEFDTLYKIYVFGGSAGFTF